MASRSTCFATGSIGIMAIAAILFLSVAFNNAPLRAQTKGVPQSITLKNGAQFYGKDVFPVPFIVGGEQSPGDIAKDRVTVVDDGMRRIFFAKKQIAPGGIADFDLIETEIDIWQKVYAGRTQGSGEILYIGPFDQYGHRVLRVRSEGKVINYVQGITKITPRYCIVDTLSIPRGLPGSDRKMRRWTMRVGTRTIPSAVLRSVLQKQIQDDESPLEHLRIVDFFEESQQYSRGLEELSNILLRFPDMTEEIEKYKISFRQSKARQFRDDILKRLDAGQTDLAFIMAREYNKAGLAGELIAEFNDIKNGIVQSRNNVQEVKVLLKNVLTQFKEASKDANETAIIERFATELETELSVDNVSRLDTFRRMSNIENVNLRTKVALAISGWLMGTNNTLENFAVVQSLFPVRDLVREYLTTQDRARRDAILKELEGLEGGVPKYLDRIVQEMTPIAPPEELADYIASGGEKPLEFFVEMPGTNLSPEPQNFRCVAHLPPAYTPYRRYPCIVTLHRGQGEEQQLNRWCGSHDKKLNIRLGDAMREGYVVISVDWIPKGQRGYEYSKLEHVVVLKALRESLRRFSIDTDRVFLQGNGAGATAAYDIGISHPELWAGVIGIGGAIDRFPNQYSKNTHVPLPVYSVIGDKDRGALVRSVRSWNEWVVTDRYLDCVVVHYKGRGDEAFIEETPEILKWCLSQRRILPDRNGFEFECKVLRPWDNFFWFFELGERGFPEKHVTRPEHWPVSGRGHNPLTISGRLNGNRPNNFNLGPANQGTTAKLWLSEEFVDFDKVVEVSGRGRFKGFVKPSRRVLLDDVRSRGDRQHPYWAVIHCDDKRWFVPEDDAEPSF